MPPRTLRHSRQTPTPINDIRRQTTTTHPSIIPVYTTLPTQRSGITTRLLITRPTPLPQSQIIKKVTVLKHRPPTIRLLQIQRTESRTHRPKSFSPPIKPKRTVTTPPPLRTTQSNTRQVSPLLTHLVTRTTLPQLTGPHAHDRVTSLMPSPGADRRWKLLWGASVDACSEVVSPV